MPGSEANERPESFSRASMEEATGRLVAVVRRAKPQVMAIYPAHQSTYPHPDHIRAHEVGLAAFNAAGDPAAFPEAGPPGSPRSCTTCSGRKSACWRWRRSSSNSGLEQPWGEERLKKMADAPQEEVTTEVDVARLGHVREEALLAHETQVDPNSPFWFGLPADVTDALGHYDEYHLARNFTPSRSRPRTTCSPASASVPAYEHPR